MLAAYLVAFTVYMLMVVVPLWRHLLAIMLRNLLSNVIPACMKAEERTVGLATDNRRKTRRA